MEIQKPARHRSLCRTLRRFDCLIPPAPSIFFLLAALANRQRFFDLNQTLEAALTSGSPRNSVSSPSASSIRLLRIASGRLHQLLSQCPGRPVLKLMGRNVLHMAATGSGAIMTLINKFVWGVQAAAIYE